MLIRELNRIDVLRHRAEQDGYKALAVHDLGRAEDCFEKTGDNPSATLRIASVCAEHNALGLAKTMAFKGFARGVDRQDLESRAICFRNSLLYHRLFCFGRSCDMLIDAPSWEELFFEVTWGTSKEHSMTYTLLFAEFYKLMKAFRRKVNPRGADINLLLQNCDALRVVFLRPVPYRDVSTAVNALNYGAKDLRSVAPLKHYQAVMSVAEQMKLAAEKLTQEHKAFVGKYINKD